MTTLDQISWWRNLLGKVGACCCLLMFLALLDGLAARFREPPNVLKVLPGMSLEVNGPLEEEVGDVRELTYAGSSPHLRLTFEAAHKGYFLGGDMWRGQLRVDPQTPPGEYSLTVGVKGKTPARPLPPYRVLVFADPLSRQHSYKSLISRHAGLSPWAAAAGFLPAILLFFGGVYYLSQKRAQILAGLGRAEIYRVASREGEYLIGFGLGTAQGLQPGSKIVIFNEQEQEMGTAEVQEATATDALAVVPADREIKPGYIVSLRRN
ncbi:MAG: hypothetical protein HY790_00370 [Deltaproteobacteria bacterium]|nr:hypothetical protein [Deltaproteobacteria bacterium]MBI4794301.1 hypothetical protein [Deltaproteobacteria bacterium]